jgi:hypothetical protein
MIRIGEEQAALGTEGSEAQQCDGICDHDFAWIKIDLIYERVTEFLENCQSLNSKICINKE